MDLPLGQGVDERNRGVRLEDLVDDEDVERRRGELPSASGANLVDVGPAMRQSGR